MPVTKATLSGATRDVTGVARMEYRAIDAGGERGEDSVVVTLPAGTFHVETALSWAPDTTRVRACLALDAGTVVLDDLAFE